VDDCYNVSYCTQKIYISDKTPPVIYCPADLYLNCGDYIPDPDPTKVIAKDDCNNAYVYWVKDSTGYDKCPKIIYRTYKAVDDCYNVSYCTQKIYIYDKVPPVVYCPSDLYLNCGDKIPDADPTKVTAKDACSNAYVYFVKDSIGYDKCPKIIYRIYKAVDDCYNVSYCTQKIYISDKTPPVIYCPADLYLNCGDKIPYADPSRVKAYDNCSAYPKVYFVKDSTGYDKCPKIIYRIYKAVDDCYNVSYCTQRIYIYDKMPPVIYCPTDLYLNCGDKIPGPDPYKVIAKDACSNAYVYFVKDSVGYDQCPKIIYRIYKAVDDCYNVSYCTQRIYISDKTPPTIYCPPDVYVKCGYNIPYPDPYKVKAYDNCSRYPKVYFVEDKVYGYGCQKTIYRTYKAVDDCYNVSTCTQKIYVVYSTVTKSATESSSTELSVKGGHVQPQQASALGVKAYPNPFKDKVQFVISSPVSGKARLELISMLGQKVATVWEGNVTAGKTQTVDYTAPAAHQTNLIYRLTVGDKVATGKLLNIR